MCPVYSYICLAFLLTFCSQVAPRRYGGYHYGYSNSGRRLQQGALVKEPSIVINPQNGESYLVIPNKGQNAFVYFPRQYAPPMAGQTTTLSNLSPEVQTLLARLAGMPVNPLVGNTKEAQLALKLITNSAKEPVESQIYQIDNQLIISLLNKLLSPSADVYDPMLETALANKVVSLSLTNPDPVTSEANLLAVLLNKYAAKGQQATQVRAMLPMWRQYY